MILGGEGENYFKMPYEILKEDEIESVELSIKDESKKILKEFIDSLTFRLFITQG
jgi:hypothetical protein